MSKELTEVTIGGGGCSKFFLMAYGEYSITLKTVAQGIHNRNLERDRGCFWLEIEKREDSGFRPLVLDELHHVLHELDADAEILLTRGEWLQVKLKGMQVLNAEGDPVSAWCYFFNHLAILDEDSFGISYWETLPELVEGFEQHERGTLDYHRREFASAAWNHVGRANLGKQDPENVALLRSLHRQLLGLSGMGRVRGKLEAIAEAQSQTQETLVARIKSDNAEKKHIAEFFQYFSLPSYEPVMWQMAAQVFQARITCSGALHVLRLLMMCVGVVLSWCPSFVLSLAGTVICMITALWCIEAFVKSYKWVKQTLLDVARDNKTLSQLHELCQSSGISAERTRNFCWMIVRLDTYFGKDSGEGQLASIAAYELCRTAKERYGQGGLEAWISFFVDLKQECDEVIEGIPDLESRFLKKKRG